MLDYQIAAIIFFALLLLSIVVIGLIETAIKKRKAEKEAFAKLARENQHLKDRLYSLKFQAALRGVNIDV